MQESGSLYLCKNFGFHWFGRQIWHLVVADKAETFGVIFSRVTCNMWPCRTSRFSPFVLQVGTIVPTSNVSLSLVVTYPSVEGFESLSAM